MTITTIVAVVFGLSVIFDVFLYSFRILWRFRIAWSVLVLALTAYSASTTLVWHLDAWTALFFLAGLYRIFATLRVAEGRMHETYLRASARRTSLVLIAWQCLALLGEVWWVHWPVAAHTVWLGIALTLLLSSASLLAATIRRYYRTAWPVGKKQYDESKLPSITVAIPARNETEDLEACLESVVASDYPKLEILVYDDCSQERRTPEIIRQFAHDGVRFIHGDEPINTWLAKNTAYDRLYKEASGEYIVFCGVDVRFGPDSLSRLIGFMQSSKKQMVSVLPRRDASVYGRFSLIQSMRYWWELAPPRRFFHRPAVVSSCWAVNRASLKKAGGFAAVSRSILPEAYFAKQLLARDAYSFRRADEHLGIVSAKSAEEQRDTAIRVRYPQAHRRPEVVFFIAILELVFLLLPFVLLVSGGLLHISFVVWLLAVFSVLLLTTSYMVVVLSTHINRWWFAVIGLPCVVITDIGLLHYSMWRYEFSTVEWKGRNVCVPAMHVIPHLPKLPD